MWANYADWRRLSSWQWRISCSIANLLSRLLRIVWGETFFISFLKWVIWRLNESPVSLSPSIMIMGIIIDLSCTYPITWLVLGSYKSICPASPVKPSIAPRCSNSPTCVCVWPMAGLEGLSGRNYDHTCLPYKAQPHTHRRWSSVEWPTTCINFMIFSFSMR